MRNLYRDPIKYSVGSNQYRKTLNHNLKPKTWAWIALIILAIAIPEVGFFTTARDQKLYDKINKQVVVNINVLSAEASEIDPKTQEQVEIQDYVREVFGKDAPKAFALLSCENASLNPDAVNTAGNYPEGSRDIGVFQVNEFWQKVNPKFLFNWKINVQIAKQLFDENHGQFNLWTCGRKLEI